MISSGTISSTMKVVEDDLPHPLKILFEVVAEDEGEDVEEVDRLDLRTMTEKVTFLLPVHLFELLQYGTTLIETRPGMHSTTVRLMSTTHSLLPFSRI